MKKLTAEQIQAALAGLKGWTFEDGKLHREYVFPSFSYAFGFMATAATAIEKLDHHPEWSNVYNRVAVDLVTHSADGVTQKDVDLALLLEGIASRLK